MEKLFKLSLLVFAAMFFSCSEEDGLLKEIEGPSGEFLSYDEVVMEQLVNGVDTIELLSMGEEFAYVTKLSFANKKNEWTTPTFEQTFDIRLLIDPSKITIKDAQNNAFDANVEKSVDANRLTLKFNDIDGDGFSYFAGGEFTVTIPARLISSLTMDDVTKLSEQGVSTRSFFYGKTSLVNAKSNKVMTYLNKEAEPEYNVKGDPRNEQYKSRLNVVYFIPSDMDANYLFRHRISEILMKHQLWTAGWMKTWGYEEKSFGLPLRKDGTVDVVVIEGEKKQAEYNASSSAIVNGNAIKKEIQAYYEKNGLSTYSDHTLVVYPVDYLIGKGADTPMPFYGSDKWCFALDYPNMRYEDLDLDEATPRGASSTWIGSLLHELGHSLNMHHVGASTSQKETNGEPLMGYGTYGYGREKTYLHEISAAVLNNCQVSSFDRDRSEFYPKETLSNLAKITSIVVKGKECTVKGRFAKTEGVEGVGIRFYDAAERNLQNDGNYRAVGFYTLLNADGTFEKTVNLQDLENKYFTQFKVGVEVLMKNGNFGSGFSNDKFLMTVAGLERVTLDRSIWKLTPSHQLPNVANNLITNLIDDDVMTNVTMVKPGKTSGGITVSPMDKAYITIDAGEMIEFNKVILSLGGMQMYTKPTRISIRASSDLSDTPPMSSFKAIHTESSINTGLSTVDMELKETAKYRHFTIGFDTFDKVNGDVLIFSELTFEK